jgi:hypothetical protein
MSPVRYKLDFISQKTAFFLVIAIKTLELLFPPFTRVTRVFFFFFFSFSS